MAGEEAYLLPRDQGPIRRYVRDVVDARRNVLGLFMPSTLALLFIMFGVPQLQLYVSPAMLVLMAVMSVDGLILGRKVSRLVDAKFPKQHRKPLEARPLRRRPGFPNAPDADAPAPSQARRQCRLKLCESRLTPVRTLVLGGIRSGKSRWAEEAIAKSLPPGQPVRYLAPGPPGHDDAAWAHRVAQHRERRPAHWSTVETDDIATQLRQSPDTPTLVDDLGTWLTGALDRHQAWDGRLGGGSRPQTIDDMLAAVSALRVRRWCWSARRSG